MEKYITSGVCARVINFEVEGTRIKDVSFQDGCDGNLKAVAKLVIGLDVDDAIDKLEGITCGPRPTSCPDQLAKALKEYKENKAI